MKIKDGYLLRRVADSFVAISVNEENAGRVVKMNATGAFLWERLMSGAESAELVTALIEKYAIDTQTAEKAVSDFVEKLRKEDLLA